MDRLFSSRKNVLLWIAGVAALLLLIYGVSLMNGFVVWDDALLVTQNPIAHGLTWANIKAAFTTYDPELYIPLTLLSFQINYALHGLQPFGYHLVNLLLHFGSVLLIAWVMFLMTKNKVAAIVTALLFGVHPINVEAVAWVSGRKDVLAAFFFLLSVGAFLKKDPERSETETKSDRFGLWYAISIASFVLGLLAKVSIVTLPVALLLIDWYQSKLPWMSGGARTSAGTKKYFLMLIPFFVLSIVFVIIASLGKSSTDEFFIEKLLMGAVSIILHMWHVIFPIGFSVLYPYTQPISILTPDILGSVIVVIAMLVGAAWILKKTRAPLFALLWFILLLAPSMTNIAKGHNELLDVYITSDRYAYLSVISIFLLFGLGVSFLTKINTQVKRATVITFVVILIALSSVSFFLAQTWKNTTTLFTQTLSHHKNAYVAYTNLGTELYQVGQVDAALTYFKKSLSIRADSTTLFNVAVIEREQGKTEEALQHFIEAAKLSIVDPTPRIAIASMLIEDGQWAQAEAFLRTSIEEARPSSQLYQILGMVLEQEKKVMEAREMYEKALEVDPSNNHAKERLQATGGRR